MLLDMQGFLGNIETFFTWCFQRITNIFTFVTESAPMTILVFGQEDTVCNKCLA